MALKPVTDEAVLSQLNTTRKSVTDPDILAQLEGSAFERSKAAASSFLDQARAGMRRLGEEAAGAPAQLPRQAGLVGRDLISAVAGIPGMAADTGVAVRNLGAILGRGDSPTLADLNPFAKTGGSRMEYEAPTAGLQRTLTEVGFPEPQGAEKGASLLRQIMVGSKLPAPMAANQAPTGFTAQIPDAVRQATLRSSREAGYVVPPATTNPTVLNRALESAGGKIATAQDAAIKNQEITNTLARRALGLADDVPLTQEAVSAVRAEAGNAYELLRGAGKITADSQFTDDLAKVTSKYSGAAKDFPELAKSEVTDVVEAVSKKEFSSESAVDLLSILRDRADKAFASGDKGLGKAYKSIAGAVEDVVERSLSAQGKKDLVSQFRDARKLIAKTHTVDKALNPSAGVVSATKLAAELKKRPLSGDLLTAAKFGQAFPKAAQSVLDSGSVRNTDVIVGAGTAALSREPTYLLYPFLRQAVRSGLLSDAGQKLAVPSVPGAGVPSEVLMGLLPLEEQMRQGLLK